jgi:sugar lactone lactonase YvrE
MRVCILALLGLGLAQSPLRAQLPTITNQPVSRAVWTGCNVSFKVGAGGGGRFAYQWLLNGTNLPNGIITTVAGNGANAPFGTYSGDGGPATNASLSYPEGVAEDAAGNLFIADAENQRVRKVNAAGTITTIAGLNYSNYSGDGGPATNAGLNFPADVAVDPSGTLFVADTGNNVIRVVNSNGIINTVAGNDANPPFGTYSGDGGPATNASFAFPICIALDVNGNLLIADDYNDRIREVNTNSIVSTVAGNGSSSYSGDGGPATNASLSGPTGAAVDAAGNLFIADGNSQRIRKVNPEGIIMTVAGNGTNAYSGDGGPATNASLSDPEGVAVDALGNVFIADTYNNRIRRVSTSGIINTIAGTGSSSYSGDGGPSTNASLWNPNSVRIDNSGNLLILDTLNQRVRKITNTQGRALGLNEVTAANAGNYQVVVTGTGGSVTSSVATLTVASSPLIYGTVPQSNRSVTLYFVSRPGSSNLVLCATNLAAPIVWQPLSTNVAGPDGDWQFTDAGAAGSPARFYRSLTQ